MRIIFMLLFFFLLSFESLSQELETEKKIERKILIYNFESNVFNHIQTIFKDTIGNKFGCNDFDLIGVSVKDTIPIINISLVPLEGSMIPILKEENYAFPFEIGFKIGKTSKTAYWINQREFAILKKIGQFELLFERPFYNYVADRNNECLIENNKIYSDIDITCYFSFNYIDGIRLNEVDYILYKNE